MRSIRTAQWSFVWMAVLCAPLMIADTNVSGTISTNTTWTLANSPYIVTGLVLVQGSGSPVLTIEPGVTVKFAPAMALVVNFQAPGAVSALGTAEEAD